MMSKQQASFSAKVLGWFDQHGRKHLPWQQNRTPYRVWVSEIMLQQTQVATVIPYYEKFMECFPDLKALAAASEDQVLERWAGLGYYSRARNLRKAAGMVCEDHAGQMPSGLAELMALPGIGRSTAAAILSLSHGQAHAILDGNVKRVLARYHAIEGWPGKASVLKQLWEKAEQHTPASRNADYTQAMMDLGAMICTRSQPDCEACPLTESCQARQQRQQHLYPGKKPRKPLPVKEAVMLMLIDASGAVLLQKRPPTGIWSGLWSLPEFKTRKQACAWLLAQCAECKPDRWQLHTNIKHTFSHFHLHAQVYRLACDIQPGEGIMEGGRYLWYNSGQAFTGGLPAPINKLLTRNLL